jgi:hypothetical protein
MKSVYDAHQLQFDSSTNIRIIEVLHDDEAELDSPISCQIHIVSLSDSPDFLALSYVWGPEAPTKTIILDGKLFTVRLNLWNFLAEFRRSTSHGFLWIDALCINQLNIKERNHQIAMMVQVYFKAEKTIVWLGTELGGPLSVLASSREFLRTKHFALNLQEICLNDYWNRLWIVQEFLLSQDIELWSADGRLDGYILCELSSLHLVPMQSMLGEGEIFDILDSCHRSSASTIAKQRASNIRINGFFYHYNDSKCSDPRDRIYGLLGVLNEASKTDYPIYPDYSKSASRLFLEVWTMSLKCMPEGPDAIGLDTWHFHLEDYLRSLIQRLELPSNDKNVVVALADIKKIQRKFHDSKNWVEHNCALHAIYEKRLNKIENSEWRARNFYRPLRRIVERLR